MTTARILTDQGVRDLGLFSGWGLERRVRAEQGRTSRVPYGLASSRAYSVCVLGRIGNPHDPAEKISNNIAPELTQ